MKTVYLIGAIGAAIVAAFGLYYSITLDWEAAPDFDVTGILWLLQNLPRLAAIMIAFVMGVITVLYLVKYWRTPADWSGDSDLDARLLEHITREK